MERRIPLGLVRNFGIMAHVDAGKTTVAEQILFNTGRIHRAGKVHEGNTVLDSDPQEARRGITISSAATSVGWTVDGEALRLQLIDTPGHVDFTIEVERSLRVLDGAVAVFDAVAGVEPQSEAVWRQAERFGVPRIALVNKLDRAGASLEHTLETMRRRLGCWPVVIQWPVGSGAEFSGLIDLVEERWISWEGERRVVGEVPAVLRSEAARAREAMIEALAERDDEVAARWLGGERLEAAAVHAGLRRVTLSGAAAPVLCGAALHNRGVVELLDAVGRYLPSPLDIRPAARGVVPGGEVEVERQADPSAPLAALAFKVVSDPFVGQVTLVRVYAGTLEAGQSVQNSSRGVKERASRLFRVHANHREPITEAVAGDIVAVAGLKATLTGDTLCAPEAPIVLASIKAPEPVIWCSIEAKDRQELTRLGAALRSLTLEDPSFQVRGDVETGQTVVGGMGELHLEVIAQRLREGFQVEVALGRPRVALRETITRAVERRERLKKMTGGPGMFAEVLLRVEPLPVGSGLEFVDEVRGGAIPKNFVAAVEEGVRGSAGAGPLGGFPLTDLRVTLLDGLTHEVDSSERAFARCGAVALQEAAREAGVALLEPLMRLEVSTPEAYLGASLGELQARRGQVQGMQQRHAVQLVEALVPLAELWGFTAALRCATQGRASSSMRLDGYVRAPARSQAELLKQAT